MSVYSQGICGDGAAILKDGAMMTVEEILAELRSLAELQTHEMSELTYKADPDYGEVELFIDGELFSTWSYEDDAEQVFEEFKLLYERGRKEGEEEIAALKNELLEVKANNERLRKALEAMARWQNHVDPNDREFAKKVLVESQQTSLVEHDVEVIEGLKFPTMLRKMWSGGEVQQWLRERANQLRNIEHKK